MMIPCAVHYIQLCHPVELGHFSSSYRATQFVRKMVAEHRILRINPQHELPPWVQISLSWLEASNCVRVIHSSSARLLNVKHLLQEIGVPTMAYKYSESSLSSSSESEQLKLFSWLPEQPWRAAVFLQHGFRSHAHFNFLRNDTPTKRGIYGDGTTANDTSLIRELNTRQIAVFAHDHVGHGRSTGVRAFFPSFKTLVDDAVLHVKHVDAEHELSKGEIPIFLLGHSMGGTVSILAAREAPTLIQGIALSSAATEPPANMFGLVGKINRALSGITSSLFPYLEVMKLPKSPNSEVQAIFEADELNCNEQGLRARVGREFLDAYEDICKNAHTFNTPFLSVHGEHDTLVNPMAAKRFYEAAISEDKTLQTGTGRWHNIFTEDGKEDMWFLFANWISERCK